MPRFLDDAGSDRIFVRGDDGRLVHASDAFDGRHFTADHLTRFTAGLGEVMRYAPATPAQVNDGLPSVRKGEKRRSWTGRAMRKLFTGLATGVGVDDAAGSGGPAGSTSPDLVGRIREILEQPRPAPLFRKACPDAYPFRPGELQVMGTVHTFVGKAAVTKGTVADIPQMKFGTTSVLYNTFYLLLGVSMNFIEQQQADLGPGMMDLGRRGQRALTEVDLTLDSVWWQGDAAAGVDGLLANPCILRYRDADIDLSTDTGDVILVHFTLIADYVREQSSGAQSVDTVLLAVPIERALERPMSSTDSTPILERVLAMFKRRGIEPLTDSRGFNKLKDIGGTGYHGAVFYNRSTPNSAPRPLLAADPVIVPTDKRWPITEMAVWCQAGDVHTDGRDMIIGEIYAS